MSIKLQSLGLVEVTSQRQADNGTVCYYDSIANCYYTSHENGYVRRRIRNRNWKGKVVYVTYQLNRTRKVEKPTRYFGNQYMVEVTERILELDPQTRFDIIARVAVKFRNKQ